MISWVASASCRSCAIPLEAGSRFLSSSNFLVVTTNVIVYFVCSYFFLPCMCCIFEAQPFGCVLRPREHRVHWQARPHAGHSPCQLTFTHLTSRSLFYLPTLIFQRSWIEKLAWSDEVYSVSDGTVESVVRETERKDLRRIRSSHHTGSSYREAA